MSELALLKRIKSLADTGLLYAESEYDKERYAELLSISLQLLSAVSGQSLPTLTNFFVPVEDYPTPKVDVRAVVFNENSELLMVREKLDGRWALPGGWAEVGFSPVEVIVKEVKEETGLETEVIRLLAVYDKKHHPHPPQPLYVYKLCFLCKAVGGSINPGFDIEQVGYFDIRYLPELSEDRILRSQVEHLRSKAINNGDVHIE